MRKAILYILFFIGIFTNVANAHTKVMGQDAIPENVSQKVPTQNILTSDVSETVTAFQKNEFINDVTDYDEYDFDEHETSLRSKPYFVAAVPQNNNSITVDLKSSSSCGKIYHNANFSRLPRFNYISLRVLRL